MDRQQDSSDDEVESLGMERNARPQTPYPTVQFVSSDEEEEEGEQDAVSPQTPYPTVQFVSSDEEEEEGEQDAVSDFSTDDGPSGVRSTNVARPPPISYTPAPFHGQLNVIPPANNPQQHPGSHRYCPHVQNWNENPRPTRGFPRNYQALYQNMRRCPRTASMYAPHQNLWLRQHADLERRRQAFNQNNRPRPIATVQHQEAQSSRAAHQSNVEEIRLFQRRPEHVHQNAPQQPIEIPREPERRPPYELTCDLNRRHYNAFEGVVRAILRSSSNNFSLDSATIQTIIDCAWSAMENNYRHAAAQIIPRQNIRVFRGATRGMLNTYTAMQRYVPTEAMAQCSICLNVLEYREPIRRLSCAHAFHLECIDKWLLAYRSCPLCRADIRPPLDALIKK